MPNRLVDAVSPYLRSHADNPVDWQQWSPEPFAEAARRDVPVLVSIGYSTCHWCHVMARESFSDPVLASFLNENFVAIKVDREEYPDVDSSYMASASVFTENLGWPLNVFVTPGGKAFYAGTYWPPTALVGHPSFRQVLEALHDAWRDRREEVEANASAVASALAAQAGRPVAELPDPAGFDAAIAELAAYEDTEFGGFGTAPKFPMTPVLEFLLTAGAAGHSDALELADRALTTMAGSDLRDPVEGGFFRYSTQRDWTDPHYERMLYDNAQLLRAYTELVAALPERTDDISPIVEGIADFLIHRMQIDGGGFGSGQDSESTVDGVRVEGGYYRLDAEGRAAQTPPALDGKVLTGWNGLAIDALALAGFHSDRADWVASARGAADFLLGRHLRSDGSLVRASIGATGSAATATLEDYGLFACGLLRLATVTGEVGYAEAGRGLVDACLTSDGDFAVPGGADPVLVQHGLALDADPSDSSHPSGLSAMAEAARRLYQLTGQAPYQSAAERAMGRVAALAVSRPVSFGAALATMVALTAPVAQLVVVANAAAPIAALARSFARPAAVVAVVTEAQAAAFAAAGFELFEGRAAQAGQPTAYLCRDFICHLPLTDTAALATELARA